MPCACDVYHTLLLNANKCVLYSCIICYRKCRLNIFTVIPNMYPCYILSAHIYVVVRAALFKTVVSFTFKIECHTTTTYHHLCIFMNFFFSFFKVSFFVRKARHFDFDLHWNIIIYFIILHYNFRLSYRCWKKRENKNLFFFPWDILLHDFSPS